jgi:peroxiredoxin
MRKILPVAVVVLAAAAAMGQGLNARLKNLEGKKVELSDLYRSKPLVVSFWATWCKPCCRELKHFQTLYETYADSGIGFLGICVNEAKDQSKVRAFLAGNRYGFPTILDPEQQAMRKFGLKDVPGSFILDTNGRAVWSHFGFKEGDEALLAEEIKKQIKRAGPDSARVEPSGEGQAE